VEIFPLVWDGFFHAGVGIVPGVPDGATVEFTLYAWRGSREYATANWQGFVSWSQATGSWDPNAVPPLPPTGPDLANPPLLLFQVPEPSSTFLGLIGGAALWWWRRRATAGAT